MHKCVIYIYICTNLRTVDSLRSGPLRCCAAFTVTILYITWHRSSGIHCRDMLNNGPGCYCRRWIPSILVRDICGETNGVWISLDPNSGRGFWLTHLGNQRVFKSFKHDARMKRCSSDTFTMTRSSDYQRERWKMEQWLGPVTSSTMQQCADGKEKEVWSPSCGTSDIYIYSTTVLDACLCSHVLTQCIGRSPSEYNKVPLADSLINVP